MKNTSKALLASALVFPGAGHLIMSRYCRGAILISTAATATIIIFLHVIKSAQQVLELIRSGQVPADFETIRQLVTEQQINSGSLLIDASLVVLAISWLIGIIDIIRLVKASS